MTYIEPNDGRTHFTPGDPQSGKPCEKCVYFDRDLAPDNPCGLCYESSDKYNWEEVSGDAGPEQVEPSDYRVCETCTGEG
jgi:hypothetical protein